MNSKLWSGIPNRFPKKAARNAIPTASNASFLLFPLRFPPEAHVPPLRIVPMHRTAAAAGAGADTIIIEPEP